MIIDCHGHYTTEPKDLHRFRKEQTAAANAKDKAALPSRASLKMFICTPLNPIDLEKRFWVPWSGWPFDFGQLAPYLRRSHSGSEPARTYTMLAHGI